MPRRGEGCNSNCHSTGWAENAAAKLKDMPVKQKLDWMHKRQKTYSGIGDAKVRTYGKRRLPTCIKLESGLLMPGFLESHEQDGNHPLLLSSAAQAKMGMIKDMRSGTVFLRGQGDFVKLYEAAGSGLKVICVSHWPIGKYTPSMFVEKIYGQDIRNEWPRCLR